MIYYELINLSLNQSFISAFACIDFQPDGATAFLHETLLNYSSPNFFTWYLIES